MVTRLVLVRHFVMREENFIVVIHDMGLIEKHLVRQLASVPLAVQTANCGRQFAGAGNAERFQGWLLYTSDAADEEETD